MAKHDLRSTGKTNIHTTFRYEIFFPAIPELKLTDDVTAYCTSSQLPKAIGEAITWHLAMGMQNHQAGKRTVQPIPLEFVIPSGDDKANVYEMLETWCTSTFNLNTGTNIGKGNYSVDGIEIRLKAEGDVIKHRFRLLRAFPTDVDYGTVNSEGNELLKVSMTLIYDDDEYEQD